MNSQLYHKQTQESHIAEDGLKTAVFQQFNNQSFFSMKCQSLELVLPTGPDNTMYMYACILTMHCFIFS